MGKKAMIFLFLAVIGSTAYWKYTSKKEEVPYNYHGVTHYQRYSLDKPDSLTFCGEVVPVQLPEVQEKLDREMYRYSYYRSTTKILVRRAKFWFPQIEQILEKNGIPEDFKYLAVIESSLKNVKSHRGAAGFWQFMSNTGQRMGLEINEEVDERYDPIKSTHAACKYLKIAHKRLGNWTNVAASYNMGIGGINRQINAQHKSSYYELELNKETGRYLYKIIALKEVLENLEKYDYPTMAEIEPYSEPVKNVVVDSSIVSLKEFAEEQGVTLEELREFNPWIKSEKLTKESHYVLKIPLQSRQTIEILEETDSTTIIKISKNRGIDSLLPEGSDSLSSDSVEGTPESEKIDLNLTPDSGSTATQL